jgi:hypothetical protein
VERLGTDKCSNLLQKSLTYGHKKSYNIGPWLVNAALADNRLAQKKETQQLILFNISGK